MNRRTRLGLIASAVLLALGVSGAAVGQKAQQPP